MTCLCGIHGRADGRNQEADFEVFARSRAAAVLLLSSAAPEEATRLIADKTLVLVRLFVDFGGRKITAGEFVNQEIPDVQQWYDRGVRVMQIGNEPNLVAEGLGSSWNNGFEFGAWFRTVYSALKSKFPDCLFGFPGVSPGDTVKDIRQNSNTFLAQAHPSTADWIGIHSYWLANEQSTKDILEFTKYNKDLYITEFANVDPSVSDTEKGRQYVAYYKSLRFIPRLKAAFAFCVSASNPDFTAWRDESGKLNVISDIVGARMPDTKLHKLGIHSLGTGQVIPLVKQAKARGVYFPVVKVVSNAGVCIDTKKIEPRTKTILRYVDENEDSSQGVDTWSSLEMMRHAANAVDFAYNRLNADEKASVDWHEIINETDVNNPNGTAFYPFGWHQFGLYLIEIVKYANLKGIKVALPAFNAGSPEYVEFQALASTGLFALMKATGHILTVHDGDPADHRSLELISSTFQNPIPGASKVFGAGSMFFRYRYFFEILKQRNEVVPCVVSEMYPGGTIQEPLESQIARIQWYDSQASLDDFLLAYTPFTIDVSGPQWSDQDYTPIYQSLVELLENTTVTPLPPNPNTHMVVPLGLNVRLHPWTGAVVPPLQRLLTRGTQVQVFGSLLGWSLISHHGNEWVASKYLSPL